MSTYSMISQPTITYPCRKKHPGAKIEVEKLDLASQESVRCGVVISSFVRFWQSNRHSKQQVTLQHGAHKLGHASCKKFRSAVLDGDIS